MGLLFLPLSILGLICFLFLVASIDRARLKSKYRQELKLMGMDRLEKEVYNFANDYFSLIGTQHKEVIQFRELILKRDLRGIKDNWKKLKNSFIRLERKAGHRGKPMLYDYYLWYEMAIEELKRKT